MYACLASLRMMSAYPQGSSQADKAHVAVSERQPCSDISAVKTQSCLHMHQASAQGAIIGFLQPLSWKRQMVRTIIRPCTSVLTVFFGRNGDKAWQ